MNIINRESSGNYTKEAIKHGGNHKGIQYLRGSIPIALYNAGIHVSGEEKFWTGDVKAGKLKGQSRAEAWMYRFTKYHNGDKDLYTLLSLMPSEHTPLVTINSQAIALAVETRWIEENLI